MAGANHTVTAAGWTGRVNSVRIQRCLSPHGCATLPMTGPLAGIRVLEAGLLIQGPQAAALLADMGADVIKVELPNIGDHSRHIHVGAEDGRSAVFTACNRGKRSVTLDLRHAQGAAIFQKLAQDADVVISNFKPGTMEAWGVGHAQLAAVNPRIICAQGSTFGPLGPDAHREGADLAGQAAGGLARGTGRDADPPSPVAAFIADHIGSLNMVAGILAALHARTETSRGQSIDVSLLGGQIWAQATEYTHYLLTGEAAGRANLGHPLIKALYGLFETADGWIGIIGVPPQARDAFFLAIDRPELALDDRLQGIALDAETLAWLRRELEAVFRIQDTAHWCAALQAAGVRYAPVRDHPEVAQDAGAWANGYFAHVQDETGAKRKVVGPPIRMSATPLTAGAKAPELGEHTEEVLCTAGISDAEMAELRERGTI